MESYPSPEVIPEDSRRSLSDSLVANRTNKEIVCCFYSLVFRVDSLDEKYPGGHMAFLMTHQGWSNEHLLTVFPVGAARQKVFRGLERYGLTEVLDWVQLDEDDVTWSWNMFNFKTEASWLKGRYKKGNIYVQYLAEG